MRGCCNNRIACCAFFCVLARWTCAGHVSSEQAASSNQFRFDQKGQPNRFKELSLADLLLSLHPTSAVALHVGTGGTNRMRLQKGTGMQSADSDTLPAELTEAEAGWLAELKACIAVDSGEKQSREERLEQIITWLQERLMAVGENGDSKPVLTEAEENAEWEGIVDEFAEVGRPWLHLNKDFDITEDQFALQLWRSAKGSDFLVPGGAGGSALLMLPLISVGLLEKVTETLKRAVVTHINPDVQVNGFHPAQVAGCPVPVILLFLDNPDLNIG